MDALGEAYEHYGNACANPLTRIVFQVVSQILFPWFPLRAQAFGNRISSLNL